MIIIAMQHKEATVRVENEETRVGRDLGAAIAAIDSALANSQVAQERCDGDGQGVRVATFAGSNAAVLGLYRCHKEVCAGKISGIEGIGFDRTRLSVRVDHREVEWIVDDGWFKRFHGTADDMGYLVIYEDGYTSWSPSEAFESGYTRITK